MAKRASQLHGMNLWTFMLRAEPWDLPSGGGDEGDVGRYRSGGRNTLPLTLWNLTLMGSPSTLHIVWKRRAEKSFSIGAGLQYWDEKSESVLASYSGFDQGSLFTGSSVLKTFDSKAARIEWIYTEVSHGKTTEYLQRIEQVSSKVKTQASSKLEKVEMSGWNHSPAAPANRLKIRVRPRMPRVLQRVDGR